MVNLCASDSNSRIAENAIMWLNPSVEPKTELKNIIA